MNLEDHPLFRYARLLLLLSVVAETTPEGIDAERLGIYDFLATYPLLLAREDGDPDRRALRLAGFDDRAICYASPGQLFASAQLRLGGDLAMLAGQGLISVDAAGRITYRLTARGADVAAQFTTMYSRSYATAARIVIRRARRLSGRRLREGLRQWLRAGPQGPHPAYPSSSGSAGEHVPDEGVADGDVLDGDVLDRGVLDGDVTVRHATSEHVTSEHVHHAPITSDASGRTPPPEGTT